MILGDNIKRVFITGGAGFIGSHLVDILVEQGYDVTVFDNLSAGKKVFLKNNFGKKKFHFAKGDLLKKADLKKYLSPDTDFVFHLAANPDISKGIKDPSLDFNQTIIATFNLLMEMKNKKISRLVFASGSGTYGDVGNISTPENFGPLLPVSMYGASKLSAEALVSAFSSLFSIKSWIFRPANIIGDRATHGVVFDFVRKLKADPKRLVILGDGNQSKSYLYISDVIEAIFLGIQKGKEKINLFNIASNSFITVNEIADLVISAMKLKGVKKSHTEGKVGWPGDVPVVRINSEKLRQIGWNPRYSSYDAVKKTIFELLHQ